MAQLAQANAAQLFISKSKQTLEGFTYLYCRNLEVENFGYSVIH